MTSHAGRLYVLALALVVFFLAWATLSAHPWGAPRSDPRIAALTAREARLRHEAKLVDQVVAARWASYRAELKLRRAQIASAQKVAAAGPGRPRRQPAAADDHEDVVIARRSFHAMGTEIELLVRPRTTGVDAQLDAAEAEFHRLEALLSRFREDSELSRLNRDGSLEAGPDLVRVLELALAARERTGGRFDPTIHNALVAAGYDRSFELLEPESGDRPRPAEAAAGRVRTDGARIELEPGVRVDLGGIAKGYAAERAAELLALAGPCLVNAGGDVAIRDGRWPVGVETADGSLTLELVERRARHLGPRPAALAARRRRAAPPDRPAHRRARPRPTCCA